MKLKTVALAGLLVGAAYATPAPAQVRLRPQISTSTVAKSDNAIIRSFRSVLARNPTERELLRYRTLMIRYGWSERDVRSDLAQRTDYRRFNRGRNTRRTAEAAVRSAYLDVLGREPDASGLSSYADKMVREGWTEQDVREALRRSDEYGASDRRTASADRIIRRAYMDVLHREPDAQGLADYRREVLENGWEYQDLRRALMRSEERRLNRRGVRESDASAMVARAYRSVLGREPDADGLRAYTERVMLDGWREADVIRALRESDEYRNRRR
jgi:TorA maturation chaperone TorD